MEKMKNNRKNNQKKDSLKQKGKFSPGNSEKNQNSTKNQQFQWKRAGKTSLIWIMIITAAIYLSGMFTDNAKKEPVLQLSEYMEFLENNQIAEGIFVDNTFQNSF